MIEYEKVVEKHGLFVNDCVLFLFRVTLFGIGVVTLAFHLFRFQSAIKDF